MATERGHDGVRARRLIEFPLAVIAVLLLLTISMDVFTFRHDDQALAAAADDLAAADPAAVDEAMPAIEGVDVWVSPTHVCVMRQGRSVSGLLSPILGRIEQRAAVALAEQPSSARSPAPSILPGVKPCARFAPTQIRLTW